MVEGAREVALLIGDEGAKEGIGPMVVTGEKIWR